MGCLTFFVSIGIYLFVTFGIAGLILETHPEFRGAIHATGHDPIKFLAVVDADADLRSTMAWLTVLLILWTLAWLIWMFYLSPIPWSAVLVLLSLAWAWAQERWLGMACWFLGCVLLYIWRREK